MLDNGVTFIRNAKPAAENALYMWDKYVVRGEEFGPAGYVEGTLTGIAFAGVAKSGLDALSSAKGLSRITGNLCFVAGTQIVTENGNRNIEEIEVGDLVYSKDALSGETGYKKVVQVFCNETTELIHVQIGNETIITTPKHPFWVEGYGFKQAALLEIGDLVETADGEFLPVTDVKVEYLDEPVAVYNFEVEDWHTYYVSDSGIWVHNTKCGDAIDLKSDKYSGTGEYGNVKGHHVHAKAAFKGDVKYDPNKGFAISQDFMDRNGLNHQAMTSKQRTLFKELYESGRPNTMNEHTRIAKEALKAGGASDSMINDLVNESLSNLAGQGVKQPTRIPWYSK